MVLGYRAATVPPSAEADPGPLCPCREKPIVCTICCLTDAHKRGDGGNGRELMCNACFISLGGTAEFVKAIKEHFQCKWGLNLWAQVKLPSYKISFIIHSRI